MKLAVALVIIAALLIVYFRWVRPYLKTLPGLAEAWRTEDSFFAALKTYFDGRKTLLAGIWGGVIGWAPDLLQIISGVDLKTALNLPDNWALIISGLAVPTLMMIFRTKAA